MLALLREVAYGTVILSGVGIREGVNRKAKKPASPEDALLASVLSLTQQREGIMAEFAVIKESDAPRPSRQTGRLAARMREYEKFVEGVPSGKVGKLTPGRGETPRGVALRVSRAAKRMGRSINTWVVEDVVYFQSA